MRSIIGLRTAGALACAATLAISAANANISTSPLTGFTGGALQLKSAGPLAFGPDGILFVGDSAGGQVVAIDTQDRKPAKAAPINIDGIDAKIAAKVGVARDQIVINDIKVNPISKDVYISAARGRGPDAMPLIVRVRGGHITVLPLDNVKHSEVRLTDAPAPSAAAGRRGNQRMLTITDMAYVHGDLMVAGLSNEEWSSALRSIPFPFEKTAAEATTIQIWHASHGRYETQAPIRTFVPYSISGHEYVLAAYTCTPLVTIPFTDLKPGSQVHGTTIADLGAGNQPLDMVPYTRDGHHYILINNTSRGVMKLMADDLGAYKPITAPTVTNVAGVPYKTIANLTDVQHLAKLDNTDVLMLTGKAGSGPAWNPGPPLGPLNLETVALP